MVGDVHTFTLTQQDAHHNFLAETESHPERTRTFTQEQAIAWLRHVTGDYVAVYDNRGVAVTTRTLKIVVTMEEV